MAECFGVTDEFKTALEVMGQKIQFNASLGIWLAMNAACRFLMCPPDYYGISRQEERWKSAEPGSVDRALAETQWKRLLDWLSVQELTAVERIEPVKVLTDLVFTARAGLVTDGIFIKSRFRRRPRRQEETEIERWFRKRNYEVKTVSEPYSFEGEADLFGMGSDLFAGYHLRSELESLETVAGMIQREPLALEVMDSRFDHLDTCFGPLNDETALIYKGAFEAYSVLILQDMVPDPIWIAEEEALRLACNTLCVGKNAVLPLGCPETRKAMEARGFAVTEMDFSEYLKFGGAAKSLVLKL